MQEYRPIKFCQTMLKSVFQVFLVFSQLQINVKSGGVQVQQESLSEVILDVINYRFFTTFLIQTQTDCLDVRFFLPCKDKTFIAPYLVKKWFTRLCQNSLGILESQHQHFGITKIRNKSCGTAFMMHICLDSGIDIRSTHL